MTDIGQSSDIYGILLDPRQSHVLLLVDDAGNWSMPHIHVPDQRIRLPMVADVYRGLSELLNADITVLRNVYSYDSSDELPVALIYVLENHSSAWFLPPNGKWIARNQLATLAMVQPEHRPIIENVLWEIETDVTSPLRPDWAYSGWFDLASNWMREQLVIQGYELTAPIEQVKTWGISCILQAATNRGSVFFKVASGLPLFGNEPAVLKALSERFPDAVPAPIAIDTARRWMLTRDFGPDLRSMPTIARWKTAIKRFCQLQTQSIPIVEDLLIIGCLDRRLGILSSQIEPLVNDEEVLGLLSVTEIDQLQVLVPRLKAMCAALADYAIPYTLNHGDLDGGNITGQPLLFFDWTDACIAHPFLDLTTLIRGVEGFAPDSREAMVNSYLSQWTAYEPMHRLREVWQLAEPLGALHQAVSYQHILASLEPASKPELRSGIPYWLKYMIQKMPG